MPKLFFSLKGEMSYSVTVAVRFASGSMPYMMKNHTDGGVIFRSVESTKAGDLVDDVMNTDFVRR
jgi:hypothetical protein